MLELKIERTDVNVDLLDTQLRTAGGEMFYGLSIERGGVILYMHDTTSSDVQKTLGRIVRQHDASQLTPQQAAREARHSQLEQGRAQTPLDRTHYTDSPALIQTLVAKIAWLEQEVRDLRGL